jgi:hypothetical protein
MHLETLKIEKVVFEKNLSINKTKNKRVPATVRPD